jgi:hypothetical protein
MRKTEVYELELYNNIPVPEGLTDYTPVPKIPGYGGPARGYATDLLYSMKVGECWVSANQSLAAMIYKRIRTLAAEIDNRKKYQFKEYSDKSILWRI